MAPAKFKRLVNIIRKVGSDLAKRKNSWTEVKIEKYLREGRGEGEGDNYKPWLTIQDVPSLGLVTRLKGWKTNRIHHFLSNLEKSFFYLWEWDEDILDIREQYPLYRIDTLKIAEQKNIRHPSDPKNQVPIVMTTDFLLTIKFGNEQKLFARAVKPSNELEKKRTIEKLELEREYWTQKGIDWAIVTEKEIPQELVRNI